MLSTPRKLLALYLAVSTLFAPVLPALAATSQNLPELGSTRATDHAPAAATKPTPEWLLQAATDPDLAPSAVRPRNQGIEQAVAKGASMLSGAASEATESWFAKQNITAELALKVDNKGVHGGSLDMLVPFYNAGKDLAFTQVGIRRANTYTEDYRNTVNLGVGYRRNVGTWLLGVNSFYDRDMTGKNDRLGVGAEAWTDFLKLSANSYMPLSSWKVSPDQTGYLERPAKGWDVRAEGYLPAYPQLGGKLIYEQYYGKEVSLFSASERQQDPRAVTVGVMYNPVPMVGIGVDHRMGQGGLADTSANLTFTYRMGESLAKQLSGDNLIASRLLANTRFNLVNRNNELVMDNRKDTVQLRLPATLSVAENQTVQFPVIGAASLTAMTWSGSAAGFAKPYSGSELAWLTLPAYTPAVSTFSAQPKGGTNSYSLQALGTDKSGRAVVSNVMTVMVYSVDLGVTANPASIQANGTSTTTLSATVKGSEGQPVGAGLVVNWKTSAGTLAATSSSTNAQGVATIQLTSPTQTGSATVEASAGSATGSTTVTFTAGAPASGSISVNATPASIAADGTSTSTLSTTLKDDHGNVTGAGVTVNWTTSMGTLASASTVTDSNGVATVVLTSSTTAGTATVQASSGNAQGTATVIFTPGAPASGNAGLSLTVSPASLPADGTSTSTVVATVKDSHGNPVGAGVSVSWSTTAGSLASATSTTDASGKASVVLTSATAAGMATVTASAGPATNTAALTFTAGIPATGSSGMTLSAAPLSITADGSSTSTLTATVKDAFGNTLPAGVQVNWTTSAGTLASPTSSTNASGIATVVLTSATLAGVATVQATSGAATNALTVTFTPGAPAAGNNGLTLNAAPASIVANGTSTTTLSATVRDMHGNPVGAGVAVSWTSSAGTLAGGTSSTDASGVTTMALTSATVAGTATVQAGAGAAHNTLAVTFNPGAPAAGRQGLILSVITATGADTATLNATVKDAFGNRVGAGVPVSWSSSAGTLGGATTSTNSNGVASVLLTNSGGPQRVTVQAISGAASDSANIAFHSGVPAVGSNGISLAVAPDDGSHATTITATVRDSYGDAVGAGIVVSWKTTLGSLAGATSTTNASGVATTVLTGSQGTSADVTGSTGAATNTITVSFTPGTPAAGSNGISLAATPPSLPADGSSIATVSATVLDAQGQHVGAGVTVNWNASLGTVAAASSITDSSGVATVVVTSSTTAGTATVTATSGSANNAVQLTYLPGAPAAGSSGLSLTANPPSIVADGSSTTQLRATVKDIHGNAVGAGVTVTWSTTDGTLASSSSSTDANGVATLVLTSSETVGQANVSASAGAASNTTAVNFTAPAPASVSVTSAKPYILADGSTNTTLTAVVSDARGTAMAGVTVTWTTSLGTLAGASSTTDSSGKATILLTSSTVLGTATVNASVGSVQGQAQVRFVSGAPAQIVITPSPAKLPSDGVSKSTLTARVTDAQGDPVGAGVAVKWSIANDATWKPVATLSGTSSMTDSAGVAAIILTSRTRDGSNTVTATAGIAQGSTAIGFELNAVVTLSPDTVPKNGQSTVSVKVTGPYGELVKGVTVYWMLLNAYAGDFTFSSPSSVTDSQGMATVVGTNKYTGSIVTGGYVAVTLQTTVENPEGYVPITLQ